jgi:hypothetical protein
MERSHTLLMSASNLVASSISHGFVCQCHSSHHNPTSPTSPRQGRVLLCSARASEPRVQNRNDWRARRRDDVGSWCPTSTVPLIQTNTHESSRLPQCQAQYPRSTGTNRVATPTLHWAPPHPSVVGTLQSRGRRCMDCLNHLVASRWCPRSTGWLGSPSCAKCLPCWR